MTRRSLFLMGVAGSAGCIRNSARRLNVFNWSSYVAPETLPNFEREFDARVRYSVYESNEEMLARVMSGNSGWDVAFPSSYFIEPMRALGLLAPLEHAKLGNLSNLDVPFRQPVWDPRLRWGVPYMWNGTGICCSRKAPLAIRSWDDLWDGRLRSKITMLDDPVDVLSACLRKLGYSINTHSESELRKAQLEALRQKLLVRAYINAEVRDQLVAGDVLAAQLWSTTSQQAIDESRDLQFVYPSEGFPLYTDVAVILQESVRKDLAHSFLNFLLRPEVAAAIVSSVKTATANLAARNLLPENLKSNAALYPPAEVLARGEWFVTSPPAVQRLRDRLWTEIKAA